MKPPAKQTIRFFYSCLIFLTVLLAASFVRAERLPVKLYTSADGLGSSFVDSMMLDSRGFMWFCTRDGLSRFDGSRFVTYQVGDKSSPPGIEIIYESRDGMYWISTTGGSYRFNPNEISKPSEGAPRLNAEYITGARGQFYEDRAGNLWLTSNGLYRLEQQDGKTVFQKVELNIPPKTGTTFVVLDITETNDDSLWINSSWGLMRRLPDKRMVYYPHEVFVTGGGSSMIADKNGRIWMTRGNEIFVIKPEAAEAFSNETAPTILKTLKPTRIVEIKPEENVPLPKIGGEIFQLTNADFIEKWSAKRAFQTSDGNVWITAENNLMQFADGTLHLHTDAEGLPNVMSRMAEDAAGNLWIGGHAGLARLDRRGLVTFGKSDGMNSSRFFAITEALDGMLYFAGRDFYMSRFDGRNFKTVRPQVAPNSQSIWTSRFLYLASNGDWWILTGDKLYRFSGAGDFEALANKSPTKVYTSLDGLKSDGMFQIFEDSGGDIWVSTRGTSGDSHGVARLKKGEEKFRTFTESQGFPPKTSASSFAEDSFGNVWLAFYEGGLARFNGERFEFFKEGLPVGLLADLHVDGKGRLWIGSTLGGLIRVDDTSAKTPSFVYFTTEHGLTSNNIRTVTEDRFGRIYVGTASGVDRFTPETGHVKHYSVNDGLAADFVVDSHCDRDGNLWFATNNGVSRLAPQPDEKSAAPQILLGGLRINGEEQIVPALGSAQIETGELSYTQNNFQIEFFGLNFRAGETLRYQYKLGGADADWSAPTEQRTVAFANLSPAEYRFLVRAVNSDGAASENPAVISFKILPPVWARWWFILICALLITGIIVLLYRYRTARLREINAALAEANRAEEDLRKSREERILELERVRSRIATDLHDDIGASLTQIAILSEVARQQSKTGNGKKGNGAVSEPLKMISNVSNELVGTMSDIVWAINPQKDHLRDLVQRMRRFASDVLSAKSINFEFEAPTVKQDIPLGANLRREVFLIFKESINNIVKHAGAAQVDIEFGFTETDLVLKISDDGCGFEVEKTAASPSLFADERAGNGIFSMQRRAREMGGEFTINSIPGKGTAVKLQLPLEQHPAHEGETAIQTGGDNPAV